MSLRRQLSRLGCGRVMLALCAAVGFLIGIHTFSARHSLDARAIAGPVLEGRHPHPRIREEPVPVQREPEDPGPEAEVARDVLGNKFEPNPNMLLAQRIPELRDLGEVDNNNMPPRKLRKEKKLRTEKVFIDGIEYPKLNDRDHFIPIKRIVHLDLKGGAYRPEFFADIFFFLNRIGATGVLIEWEDMFPYTGNLSSAVNGNAYTMEEIEGILLSAQKHRLVIVPLVQTFGHLEWILKLDQFRHLRDDPLYPQVICAGDEEAWELLKSMIDQVANVHKKYGMEYYHMGADEVFQFGTCNASRQLIENHRFREDAMLYHIAKVAKHIKTQHRNITVLAWHDVLVLSTKDSLLKYRLPNLIIPVLWNYAESLDYYLPAYHWEALRVFPRMWTSSAWKGADGPLRYDSNPMHYIKNHQAWIEQMTRNHEETIIEGLIMTGWSRYDHLATICELFPVAVPSLALSMETILTGENLNGNYPITREILGCTPSTDVKNGGHIAQTCNFPGIKLYKLINQYSSAREEFRKYRDTDFELNGWLSRGVDKYQHTSLWYIQKIEVNVRDHYDRISKLADKLRTELDKIYFPETANEFIEVYMGDELDWLEEKLTTIKEVKKRESFPKRPFVEPRQWMDIDAREDL